MEPYEIAAFLGAVEVVLEHARPGHAVTVQQAGGDVRSALHIRWPVVELVIERDTNIGRASFAGPQRLAVALTTMKWVDGQLTPVGRRPPLPRPHTQLCIRYAYDMRAYAMLAAGEVPALYSYAELCRQLLVDIVRPWARTAPPPRTRGSRTPGGAPGGGGGGGPPRCPRPRGGAAGSSSTLGGGGPPRRCSRAPAP